MTFFTHTENRGHESVHYFDDPKTGLRAIIAIHSTALGPAAGGSRMWQYSCEADATRDALRLSRGMTYKNAMAGLPLGGGKAVIIANSKTDKLLSGNRSVRTKLKDFDKSKLLSVFIFSPLI